MRAAADTDLFALDMDGLGQSLDRETGGRKDKGGERAASIDLTQGLVLLQWPFDFKDALAACRRVPVY